MSKLRCPSTLSPRVWAWMGAVAALLLVVTLALIIVVNQTKMEDAQSLPIAKQQDNKTPSERSVAKAILNHEPTSEHFAHQPKPVTDKSTEAPHIDKNMTGGSAGVKQARNRTTEDNQHSTPNSVRYDKLKDSPYEHREKKKGRILPTFATVDIIAGSLAYKTQTEQPAISSWRWGLVGESLTKGTTIKTGPNSLASFILVDGSQLKLNCGTQISLLTMNHHGNVPKGGSVTQSVGSVNAIQLDRGDVWLRVAKSEFGKETAAKRDSQLRISNSPNKRVRYAIITDKAEVRITGTTLAVSASPRETATTVTEGKVIVSRKGKEITLEAGQRGIISDTVAATASISDASKDLSWTRSLKGVALLNSRSAQAHHASIGRLLAKDPDTGKTLLISIKQLQIDVTIQNQIAKTTVEETFANATNGQLEGTFYFPLPTGASISRLAMYIGDKLVEGEIVERERAGGVYKDIVRKMKNSTLLEWQHGNIFKCRVFPIPPHGEKRIILSYTQVLKSDYSRVQYIYPMAIGLEDSTDDTANSIGEFNLNVAIQSAPEIKSIYSPSHKCKVVHAEHRASVKLSAQNYTPDSDFILNYQITKNDNELFVLPHRESGDEDGYFMLRLFPEIRTDSVANVPKDYIFLVDTSGSMAWKKYRAEIKVVRTLLNEMGTADRFNIVCYDIITSRLGDKFISCNADNKDKAVDFLNSIVPSGASDIKLAFESVSNLLKNRVDSERPICIFFIGDGLATAGPIGAAYASGLADEGNLRGEIKKILADVHPSVYTIAIGNQYDATLLKWLAKEFNGVFRHFSIGEDIAERAFELAVSLTRPMMRDVKITVNNSTLVNVFPRSLINIYQGQELIIIGRYKHAGETTVTLTGKVNGKETKRNYYISLPAISKENAYIPRLWARCYTGFLLNQMSVDGGKEELIDEIIGISKDYSIMTPFTSFVVLENKRLYEKYQIERRKAEMKGGIKGQSNQTLEKGTNEENVKAEPKSKKDETSHEKRTAISKGDTIKERTKRQLTHVRKRTAGTYAFTTFDHTAHIRDFSTESAQRNIDKLRMSEGKRRTGVSEHWDNEDDSSLGRGLGLSLYTGIGMGFADYRDNSSMSNYDSAPSLFVYDMQDNGEGMSGETKSSRHDAALDAELYRPKTLQKRLEVERIVEALNEPERALKAPTSKKSLDELRKRESLNHGFTDNDLREVKRIVNDELQLRDYTARIQKTPQDPNLYRRIANILAKRGDWDGTLRAFSTIVEMNPQDVSARRELAQLYQGRKLYDKAFEEFKAVLALNPEDSQSSVDISRLAQLWGKSGIAKDAALTQVNDTTEVDIKVILSWDTDGTDVDLWVINPSGEKCFYAHNYTKSGGRLFTDITTGHGQEVFTQKKAAPGEYKIIAHYYADNGKGKTKCEAVVILHVGKPNEERKEYELTLNETGDKKEIATVTFP